MYGQGMGFPNWLCGGAGFMPGPLGVILTILFWAVIIGLAVKVFQFLFSSKAPSKYSSSHDILKARYAAGEISKPEFDQMEKDIA
jgi:uncharacterized membrane protein